MLGTAWLAIKAAFGNTGYVIGALPHDQCPHHIYLFAELCIQFDRLDTADNFTASISGNGRTDNGRLRLFLGSMCQCNNICVNHHFPSGVFGLFRSAAWFTVRLMQHTSVILSWPVSIGLSMYFDMFSAVSFSIFVLANCYNNFHMDRAVFLLNLKVLAHGAIERGIRMQANPVQVALFRLSFDSLRILSAKAFDTSHEHEHVVLLPIQASRGCSDRDTTNKTFGKDTYTWSTVAAAITTTDTCPFLVGVYSSSTDAHV